MEKEKSPQPNTEARQNYQRKKKRITATRTPPGKTTTSWRGAGERLLRVERMAKTKTSGGKQICRRDEKKPLNALSFLNPPSRPMEKKKEGGTARGPCNGKNRERGRLPSAFPERKVGILSPRGLPSRKKKGNQVDEEDKGVGKIIIKGEKEHRKLNLCKKNP